MSWEQIWERKGRENTTNLQLLDGFEKTHINMEKVGEYIRKILRIEERDYVLEIGCGAGFLAQYIAPYCKYTGIDKSKTLLEKHRALLNNLVYECDANDLIFENKYFDKSFSYSVFHHFPNKDYMNQVLNEMKRVTKKKIFIGDIPANSEDSSHLLYSYNDFKGKINKKFCSNKNRFNVVIERI